jgi:trk system potassium uptake protein TrkA
MSKQVMVIGLGQFGMSLSRALADRDVEVLAVDTSEPRVRAASEYVAEALCFDATDELALARTAPERRDACVCAIGDEAREAAIICTALLKQMGATRLVARSNDDLLARILRLVGADVVINPEREFGNRFATMLLHERVLGELPLGGGLVLTEMKSPAAFVGRSLIDLELPRRHGLTVVAIRRPEDASVNAPDPRRPLGADDVLIVVSHQDAVADLLTRFSVPHASRS